MTYMGENLVLLFFNYFKALGDRKSLKKYKKTAPK